jgi:hypothetical protein
MQPVALTEIECIHVESSYREWKLKIPPSPIKMVYPVL